ncbi:MAG: transposase [Phycisphaerales bacterium]|nr:transposase [Phycisphaerales bacterium]
MTLLVDCQTHLMHAIITGRGPLPGGPDIDELVPLLGQLPEGFRIGTIVADAGFDSASNHRFVREEHGLTLIAPPTHGRPRKDGGPPRDVHRRTMHRLLKTPAGRKLSGYSQRWQAETVNSMIKRNLTDALSSKRYQSQSRELRRLAVVHNIMV